MVHQKAVAGNRIYEIPVPKNANFSGPLADQLARLAFFIMMTTASREEYQRGFWIPFSAEKGRTMFGSAWDRIRKEAASSPFFEFNDHYNPNPDFGPTFCKSVRLAAPFRTGEVDIYQFRRKQRPGTGLDYNTLDKASKRLVDSFSAFTLPGTPPAFDNVWQAFTWARIDAGDYYASRCEFGRFHSNFTSFKHRSLLQYAEPLAVLDIVACQPLILGAVVAASQPLQDVLRWLDICNKGDLYAHIAELSGSLARDEVKKSLITCIFQRLAAMRQMPIFSVLRKHFPTISKHLESVKQGGYHQAVAHQCQRLESSLMIDTVAMKLAKVPLVTVHDELIFPAKFVEKVKEVVLSVFSKACMQPRLKVEIL
jgi:hypothetical protein